MNKSNYYVPNDQIDGILKSELNEKFTQVEKFKEYSNAIILPARLCRDKYDAAGISPMEGGVCDPSFNFIEGYKRHRDDIGPAIHTVIRAYKPASVIKNNENVIYGGILINQFGHFILDSMVRLWFWVKHAKDNYKIAFILKEKFDPLTTYHAELLDLLGISTERIFIIDTPTQFKTVIVPCQSVYWVEGYDSELFSVVYDLVRNSVTPHKEEKIYLSRSKFEKKDIFGENYFEKFFENKGYKVIYPEQLPLKEQIAYMAGAKEVVCTTGTLAHHALFSKNGTKWIYLLRGQGGLGKYQCIINEAKKLSYTAVNVSQNLFPTYGFGHNGLLIGPTPYWSDFISNEYNIKEKIDVFKYLDKADIKLGEYLKLYLTKTANKRNFSRIFGYRFDYIKYIKSLYMAFDPDIYNQMQQSMKFNDSTLFRGRVFVYKTAQGQKITVALTPSGKIMPVDTNNQVVEAFWSFLNNRLYFLSGDYHPLVEFVVDVAEKKHNKKAIYYGVQLSRVTDTCTLKSLQTGTLRNWIIRHIIKFLVDKKSYKELKQKPDLFFRKSKKPFIRYLGKYYISTNSTIIFFWRKQFQEYFNVHNMKQMISNLKQNMDEISCKYIDHFMRLSKYWYKGYYAGDQWTEYDIKKQKGCREFAKTLEQQFPEILKIKPYFFYDIYGLADLPPEVLSSIDGKIIIDGGG